MVAAGNDFVVIGPLRNSREFGSLRWLSQKACDRKYGIGADGLLLVGKSKVADVRMRIFNADGSEAEMCGNGARCVALYISRQPSAVSRQLKIETRAGIIDSYVNNCNVKIKLTDPRLLKLDIPLKVNSHSLKVNFINTGVPHCVIFVEGLDKIGVTDLGRQIRYHKQFLPFGTNVDFIEMINNNSLKIRTYERGVEDETLACGTGSVASALVCARKLGLTGSNKINVLTKSGDKLKIYFKDCRDGFRNVWLEGSAEIVYKGAYYV